MAQKVKIRDIVYSDVPYVNIPKDDGSGDAIFYDTSGNDVQAKDVRSGKKFTGASGQGVGTLTEVSSTTHYISTPDQQVTIAAGIHNGQGKVAIDPTEAAKINSDNILANVTIMGKSGNSMNMNTEIATNAAGAEQISAGYKACVNGQKITGTAVAISVTQDSSTKALRIF